jgi:hypothetical protein
MITRDDLSAFHANMILHCEMCLDEKPDGVSAKDWSRLSFGTYGKEDDPGVYLQLWCNRHDCNITTIYIATDEWGHADGVPLRVSDEEDTRKDTPNGLHP